MTLIDIVVAAGLVAIIAVVGVRTYLKTIEAKIFYLEWLTRHLQDDVIRYQMRVDDLSLILIKGKTDSEGEEE